MQALRERAADRHRLAHRLHLSSEHASRSRELLECPSRHLRDDVVDHRLETRWRFLRDVVRYLVQGVTDRQLRGNLGDWKARRLRGERRGPGNSGVHFDHHLFAGRGVDCELDVRSPRFHTHATNTGERCVTHLLILDVGERHRRSHGDRVTRVHSHRVDVLDRTDDHAIVGAIPHDFEFIFLPSGDRLLDQHLRNRAGSETVRDHPTELLFGVGDTRPTSTEDVRGPDDHRQRDIGQHRPCLFHRMRDTALWNTQTNLQHGAFELVAIFSGRDRLSVRPDQLGRTRNTNRAECM